MASANKAPLVSSELQIHQIKSKFVDQTFEIYVQVPIQLADGSEQFPVLYMTDSYGGVVFDSTTALMQLGGDIPRLITVGIGYHDAHVLNALDIRQRDLTPVEFDSQSPSLGPMVQGVPKLDLDKKSGGAPEFLRFIREELQPFIDKNYPTIPEDRGYWGDSLGGLFGLYILFNQPDTFNRYIIGSPSIWWADRAVMNDAQAFVDSGKPLNAKVFIAVGALEAGSGNGMVSNVFRLEDLLLSANIEGLELTTHLFPNETHTSVIAMNYIRGLQSVYERPEMPFVQQLLAPPGNDTGNEK